MDRIGLRLLLLSGLFLTGMATSQAAQVYKWVDEQGITHYAEQLPRNAPGMIEMINTRATHHNPSATLEALRKREAAFQDRRKKEQELQQESDQATQASSDNAARCKGYQQSLTALTNNPRQIYEDDSGQMVRMTEEKRQAKIKDRQRLLQQNCQ